MTNIQDRIQIIVATHKKYRMPKDPMYLPLHVGAEGKIDKQGRPLDLGYMKDNIGENISAKNGGYCELTGLYWAWKNLKSDYIGLVHYRRHFTNGKKSKDRFDSILTYPQVAPDLDKYRVFVPQKRHYYIETLSSHYAHTHYIEQLDKTRDIIAEKYPDYLETFDQVIQQRSGYMFNMMIMRKDDLDRYCTWLFDILFVLEKQIDGSQLSAFQQRYPGRISEIIFNVWLQYQVKIKQIDQAEIKELPYANMEKTNWFKKGGAFLKAKFFHKRYEGSF